MPQDVSSDQVEFLRNLGIRQTGIVHSNLTTSQLYEAAIERGEGHLSAGGPFVVLTGKHTGRSPKDKYVVKDESTDAKIWWGAVNHPMTPVQFDSLLGRVTAFLQGRELFLLDASAGADADHQLPIRVVTMHAWHCLFAKTMFLPAMAEADQPFTVLHAPDFLADPALDGTRSETVVAINFARRLVIICGTQYAGEIKKSIFTVANYMLPHADVLPMHCSANEGPAGDVAIFFGLSGTGKTTLSADPERSLIGDDEHGWSDSGIFNIEGGCYAKVIKLSPQAEPEIYATTHRFGTIMENVDIEDGTAEPLFDSSRYTENTRAAYPLDFIPGAKANPRGGHPANVIMLTADAFGVLPPISRLSSEQAMYHFLSGYTAKVAGTEIGVTEPVATFSACFGGPFLPLPPVVYANLLGERLEQHQVNAWLVNTGWTGGPYGVGHRMPIAATRAIIRAILDGDLAEVPTRKDPVFGFDVPTSCVGVPTELLDPRGTWPSAADYDVQARKLATMFVENFAQFGYTVSDAVRNSGPSRDRK